MRWVHRGVVEVTEQIEATTFEIDGWLCTKCDRGFLTLNGAQNHARYCTGKVEEGGRHEKRAAAASERKDTCDSDISDSPGGPPVNCEASDK